MDDKSNIFDKIVRLVEREATTSDTPTDKINSGLDHFSETHIKLTVLLVKTLKKIGNVKYRVVLLKEQIRSEEDDLLASGTTKIGNANNRDERMAIVRTSTEDIRSKLKSQEAILEKLEAIRQAISAGLNTVNQKRDSLSRQLSIIDIEERIDR